MKLSTIIRLIAKQYGIRYAAFFNDKRTNGRRFKFYCNTGGENVRWFILRLRHDFPLAHVTIIETNYCGNSIAIYFPR